jgi:hypothetical protein
MSHKLQVREGPGQYVLCEFVVGPTSGKIEEIGAPRRFSLRGSLKVQREWGPAAGDNPTHWSNAGRAAGERASDRPGTEALSSVQLYASSVPRSPVECHLQPAGYIAVLVILHQYATVC